MPSRHQSPTEWQGTVLDSILHRAIALDQLAWVLLTLGKGHPDETISAAAWRMEQQGKRAGRILRPAIDALFWPLERDHCRKSFESELSGRQLHEYYRSMKWD